jgi:hypothetical protein
MSKPEISGVDRRQFITAAIASTGVFPLLPISDLLAADQRKLLWAGINFMQASGNKKLTPIPDYFPNIYPILKSEEYGPILYNKIPGKWGAPVGKSGTHKIVWVNSENNLDIAKDTDLGIMVGVSSDRAIARKYYPEHDYTILVYELQTYLFIFNIEKFEIVQSWPIRIWSYDMADGRAPENALQSRMLTSLGGTALKKNQINLPTILQDKLQEIDLKDQKSVNLRVTTMQTRVKPTKWVAKENQKLADFEAILGNSLTNLVSKNLKIGIQPFAPGGALFQMTTTFMGSSGEDKEGIDKRDTSYTDKLLNAAPIDLEIRAESKAIIVKKIPKPEHGDAAFINKIILMVGITVGRWERTYDDDQKLVVSDTKLKELVFKQNIMAISQEITTGEFTNNWYYVLDLHERMFNWFFAELAKGTDYPKMSRGRRDKFKTREFLTRVRTKDYPKFEREAIALRAALLAT